MRGTTLHDWQWIKGRTPSGKTRKVKQCRDCKLVTYSSGRLTTWQYPDGRIAQTQTVDAPTCGGMGLERMVAP